MQIKLAISVGAVIVYFWKFNFPEKWQVTIEQNYYV